MREALEIIAQDNALTITDTENRSVYDYLQGEINSSKHGNRFGTRAYDISPSVAGYSSPLDAAYPYTVCADVDPETQSKIATAVGNFIMPSDNLTALTEAFKDIYSDEAIIKHKLLGGSLLFLSNHVTYADQPAETAASTLAKLDIGYENPHETQDMITHRLVGQFAHDLISTVYELEGLKSVEGFIMEDVLMLFASILQTLPNSNSGYTGFVEKVKGGSDLRQKVNGAATKVFPQLCRLGGRDFFVAGSGQEMVHREEDGRLHEKQVGKGTATMLTSPNAIDHAGQLLTIPLYIHPDPFTGDRNTLLEPKPTPFVFLEPRLMKKPSDVHHAMAEIIEVGNDYKPSGVPRMEYDIPGLDMLHKDVNPEIMIAHSV